MFGWNIRHKPTLLIPYTKFDTFSKQWRFRLAGFIRSLLIRNHTVFMHTLYSCKYQEHHKQCKNTCVDPEIFIWGGPTSTVFWGGWWGKEEFRYHYKWAIIGPPAKRHLNGVLLAGWWWLNIECRLGSFVIFQGIWTSIAKIPYIFVIFQGGGGGDRGSPPLWICTWNMSVLGDTWYHIQCSPFMRTWMLN